MPTTSVHSQASRFLLWRHVPGLRGPHMVTSYPIQIKKTGSSTSVHVVYGLYSACFNHTAPSVCPLPVANRHHTEC